MPFTLTCPAKMTGRNGTGGEGGVVMAGPVALVWHSSPCPIDLTRRVRVGGRNMAEMQGVGPGPAGGGMANGQPATVKGGADIGTGAPMILTLGLGAVGMAVPPCAHVTLHCIVSRKPGIT